MNKLFIIGLPRTGTTSISVALLEHFKVAHTAYTKRAFEFSDVISDCPCFSDYQQLDVLFPNSKFVNLQRSFEYWLPSIQMLLSKMLPSLYGQAYINPILKRSFIQTFDLDNIVNSLGDNPLNKELLEKASMDKSLFNKSHLLSSYQKHQQTAIDYFQGRNDLLSIDISEKGSLSELLSFLEISHLPEQQFPHLNVGKRVDNWKAIKHPHKVNANMAGNDGRKYFTF